MRLEEVLQALSGLPPAVRAELEREAIEATKGMRWVPNPGPQTEAYHSQADLLLFGGEPGGGKSQLILGLAFNCHERSLVMRRQYTDLDALTEEAIRINGGRDGYNGSPPPSLKFDEGKRIDFGAASRAGDEQHWMGRPHDFIGFDEATQFTAKQIRFLRGWLRTTTPGQRTRTVLATNPPLTADGTWVHEMFAPWINPQHPNPAKPGELRWYVVDADDRDIEVEGPGTYTIDGKSYEAESRTFIPSKMTDNPQLDHRDYQKRLDALPAEVREILMGGFRTSFRDQPMQIIPTAWVMAAQDRWTANPPEGVPMCAMGVDASGGGADPMVIAPRYDGWFDKLIRIEGKEIPQDRPGKHCAGLVVSHRRDNATMIIDMGGGYGGPMYEQLLENFERTDVIPYKGAEGSAARTKDKQLGFANVRAQALWQFREALDPSQPGGSPLALPPNHPRMVADLTAPTFEVTARGIVAESKESVCERLQRSTDEGDAVVMAWFRGPKRPSHHRQWTGEDGIGRRKSIRVDLGARRARGTRGR
jgi:hypothetical protein